MMAHIHQAKSGENGPPIVKLSTGKAKLQQETCKAIEWRKIV
jgi:hypothetical protein